MTTDAIDADDQRTRAQVWEAIRRLSDDEHERMQHLLLVSRSASRLAPGDRNDTPAAVRIPLTLIDDTDKGEQDTNLDNQADNDVRSKSKTMAMRSRTTQWAPSDLIHVFLSELHHVVHSQQATSDAATSASAIPAADASSSANATVTKAKESNAKTLRAAKLTKSGGTNQQLPFALQSNDFPSLIRGSAPAKTTSGTSPAVQRPAVKAAKRRITTTLVSDQNVITRPVLNPVAFPPLGGSDPAIQSNNPWAKRELLERRMMPSAEGSDGFGSALESTPPSKPWEQQHLGNKSAETRISSAAKIPMQQPLFDDSPPGGPKRVLPFAGVAAQRRAPASNVAATECNSPMVTPVKNAAKPPPTPLCVKQKRPRRQSLLPNNTESSPVPLQEPSPHSQLQDEKKCADDFQINAQAAKLYGFLIRKRFVGSTYTELQLLISLLFRSDCTGSSSSGESSPESVSTCGFTNEFCWRSHCLSFAALVFNGIEATLTSLGTDLLRLLMRSLADAGICAEMLARLQHFAQRREELRVEESARIGCKLPIETKASAVRDFALPFCEEIDSRLHYRSPTESVMYSNREKIRDGFLNLLRQFQKQQHSLVGIENASVAAAAIDNARKLFGEVAPENRWWFAKFFVMELLQVGSNPFGESDKDLVLKIMEDKLVVKNPDRLRKLHRRFTSQKQSNKAPTSSNGNQGPSGSSTASNHFGSTVPNKPSGGNTTSSWKADRPESRSTGGPTAGTATNGGNTAITTTFENTRQHFAENQQFFFHFLHSCDSYEFSQLVKYQLEFQFQSIWKETINADPRKTFTETVLKLKVVAKFLGYLRFSPQWHNSSSLVQLSKQNPAFKAAEKEAVGTLENTSDTLGLDVKLLLEQSIIESTISKCVPWLCDYLTMLSLDKLSTATTYFKQLLVLLERIYHSSRLDGLGETGLYIGMQIERVFHVLELDIAGFMDDAEFRSPSLLPSSKLLLILEEVESSAQSGEDNLPFLYSQVFVQSCVNELEDLRGFIQTRAKPSHRVTKRATASGAPLSGASQLTAIRKLRPLQVITEDEHNDTTADATMSSTATSLTDDDRLSESIFKIHPNLKKVVEFVVEVVATNICEHVVQQVAIPSADAFVNSCVKDSGLASPQGSSLSSSSSSVTSTELEATTIVFLQLLESRVFRTIQETVVRSLQETTRLCNDHVRASIPPLLPPSCHSTLAQSVLLVALNRTRGVTNNLIPKSCRSEFTKRLALRKKAILKETAFKSAAAAANASGRDQEHTSSGDEDDGNVVRTLSSMFDEHAGVEDSREEEIFALKHVSAQVFKLSRSRGGGGEKAPLAMEDWTKVHVSVARHLKTFASRLRALQRADERLEQDRGGSNHDLPVWDATWRVTTSCLRVLTRFSDEVVVAEWMDSERTQVPKTQALEGSVAGFTDAFIALLSVATCLSSKERSARTETQEDVAVRRIQALVEAAVESLVAKPSQLNLGARACDSVVLERLVLNPRARILAALMTANDAEPAFLMTQRSSAQHEPHDNNATKSLSDAQQFRSEVWRRTTTRHS